MTGLTNFPAPGQAGILCPCSSSALSRLQRTPEANTLASSHSRTVSPTPVSSHRGSGHGGDQATTGSTPPTPTPPQRSPPRGYGTRHDVAPDDGHPVTPATQPRNTNSHHRHPRGALVQPRTPRHPEHARTPHRLGHGQRRHHPRTPALHPPPHRHQPHLRHRVAKPPTNTTTHRHTVNPPRPSLKTITH